MIACSGEVYGAHADLPVTEEHPLRPRNPYAVSKAAADHAAALYQEAHGMHVVRMRAFNHAGPGQSDSHVVSQLARQIAEGEAAAGEGAAVEIVTGGLDVRRDFTDVRDVVRAYRLALEHAAPGAYNVCSGRSTSIRAILEGLSEHAEVEIVPRTDPAQLREREVHEIRGSNSKLARAAGWAPEIPLERTLADTLDWWRGAQTVGAWPVSRLTRRGFERLDLLQDERARVLAGGQAGVPCGDARERLVEVPARRPAQPLTCLGGVQPQVMRFVRVLALVLLPGDPAVPQLRQPVGHVADGDLVALAGAEVPGLRELGRLPHRLGQQQVAAERVQHVLPGPDRVGVADRGPACPASAPRIRSGTSRSSPQSPPPITLPARALATAVGAPGREEGVAVGGGRPAPRRPCCCE